MPNTLFGLPNDHAKRVIHGAMSRPVPWKNANALRPELFAEAVELLEDQIVRLVPRNGLPLVLAVFGGIAFHRRSQTILVVDSLHSVQATNAQTTFVERILGVSFHLDELSVFIGKKEERRNPNGSPDPTMRFRVCR